MQAFICETRPGNINCTETPCSALDITYTNYGRTSIDVCNDNEATLTNCSAADSTFIVREICQGNVTCTLQPSNIFGEACSGVSKYLEVQFKCITSGKTIYRPILKFCLFDLYLPTQFFCPFLKVFISVSDFVLLSDSEVS